MKQKNNNRKNNFGNWVYLIPLTLFGIYNLYIFFTNGFNLEKVIRVAYFENKFHMFSAGWDATSILGLMLFGAYGGLLLFSLIAIIHLISKIFGAE